MAIKSSFWRSCLFKDQLRSFKMWKKYNRRIFFYIFWEIANWHNLKIERRVSKKNSPITVKLTSVFRVGASVKSTLHLYWPASLPLTLCTRKMAGNASGLNWARDPSHFSSDQTSEDKRESPPPPVKPPSPTSTLKRDLSQCGSKKGLLFIISYSSTSSSTIPVIGPYLPRGCTKQYFALIKNHSLIMFIYQHALNWNAFFNLSQEELNSLPLLQKWRTLRFYVVSVQSVSFILDYWLNCSVIDGQIQKIRGTLWSKTFNFHYLQLNF